MVLSVFGNATNFKVASRCKLAKKINLRGALSNGFRASSLHQIYFSTTAALFFKWHTFGSRNIQQWFANGEIIGIFQLKQEVSKSGSIGFTVKIPDDNLTFSADDCPVNVKDKVVLTSLFSKPGDTPASRSAADILNGLF